MVAYTAMELREFDELTEMLSSRSQMARIMGRIKIKEFVEKHGREKCDAMFAALQAKDAKKAARK